MRTAGRYRGKGRGGEWSTLGQVMRRALSETNFRTIIKLSERQFGFSYHHGPQIVSNVIKHSSSPLRDHIHHSRAPGASLPNTFVQGSCRKTIWELQRSRSGGGPGLTIHLAREMEHRRQSLTHNILSTSLPSTSHSTKPRAEPSWSHTLTARGHPC